MSQDPGDRPLPEMFEQEWQQLQQECQQQDPNAPGDAFRIRARSLYDRLIRSWQLEPLPVMCPSCHQRLDGHRQAEQPCDDPTTWTFRYEQGTPMIVYLCSQCVREVRQQYQPLV